MFKTEVTNRAGKVVARLVFSDRLGGVSAPPFDTLNLAAHVGDGAMAVGLNRSTFAQSLQVPVERITWPGLTHSTDIGVVDSNLSHFPDVDILITKLRKQALATLGADCVQLLGVETEKQISFTAHMGWKGAVANLPSQLKLAVESQGGSLKNSKVYLGPAICGNCYQVESDRINAVCEILPAAKVGTGLDLRVGIANWLREQGTSVEVVGGCTSCDKNLFSFRRDAQTGRQAGAVVLL